MTEVAAWMLYSIVIANLLGLAAMAGESALRDGGKPGRWAWVASMVASLALPLLAWLGLSLRSVPAVPESALIPLAPLATVPLSAGSGVPVAGGPGMDRILLVLWIGVTVVALIYMLLSWAAVVRDRRHWRTASVGGVRVALTPDLGPAAWGVRHPQILLPEWAIELEARVRRLMLLHEGEHVRAGDTRVVLMGLLLLAVAPWNLPLWWQFRRLRQAIELDCDARVLRRAPDARRYGSLLLEVGRRRSTSVMVVALADPPSFLERRIRLITAKARIPSLRRVSGMALVAGGLVVVAICTRDPMAVAAAPVDPLSLETAALTTSPLTVASRLLSPAGAETRETAAPVEAEAEAKAQGGDLELIADRPVDPIQAGGPESTETVGLSTADVGSVTLDERQDPVPAAGAIDVGTRTERMQEVRDESPDIALPQSTVRSPAAVAEALRTAAAAVEQAVTDGTVSPGSRPTGSESAAGQPAGASFTSQPELQNLAEIQTLIEKEYPPLLRDAGIGGRADVWLLIDTNGEIVRTQLTERTGQPALDEAALRVAAAMRFTPAVNQGEATTVWVSQAIAFTSR